MAVDCFERRPDVDVTQDATGARHRAQAAAARGVLPRFGRTDAADHSARGIPPGAAGIRPAGGGAARAWTAAARHEAGEDCRHGGGVALLVAGISLFFALRPPRAAADFARLRASRCGRRCWPMTCRCSWCWGITTSSASATTAGRSAGWCATSTSTPARSWSAGFIGKPDRASRYADLNLGYLPTSSAQALREVLPVVMASGKPVMLTLASELDPATLKTTHVVYLGYLSALGMLRGHGVRRVPLLHRRLL